MVDWIRSSVKKRRRPLTKRKGEWLTAEEHTALARLWVSVCLQEVLLYLRRRQGREEEPLVEDRNRVGEIADHRCFGCGMARVE